MTFGIMQGRLSAAPAGRPQAFPWSSWADEFSRARALGFSSIEWLVTAERPEDNPLATAARVQQIRDVIASTGVRVSSVCADCFIPLPLVGAHAGARQERIDLLAHIIRQSAQIDARVVVLPLLETNAPADKREALQLLGALDSVLQMAAALGVRIALETSWPGAHLNELIVNTGKPGLGACYDIGNAAAFGLRADEDLRALGPLLIDVHVKDRRRSGESVALGDGDADLSSAFRALDELAYLGPVVLETPVGQDPTGHASRNLAVTRAHACRSAGATS
jgi:L-ribulose-5-phosphate 3-epimerase